MNEQKETFDEYKVKIGEVVFRIIKPTFCWNCRDIMLCVLYKDVYFDITSMCCRNCNTKIDVEKNTLFPIEDDQQMILTKWLHAVNLSQFLHLLYNFGIPATDDIVHIISAGQVTIVSYFSVTERVTLYYNLYLEYINSSLSIEQFIYLIFDHYIHYRSGRQIGMSGGHSYSLSTFKILTKEVKSKNTQLLVKKEWEMETDTFDSYIQWLPHETMEDVNEIIGFHCGAISLF